MRSIISIALTTFRELIRERLFIIIFFIAIGLLLFSVALSNLSIWEYQRILSDLGLASMELAVLGIVLFSGSYMINKEIEKQTCLLLLSKPLTRTEFIIGKMLGLSGLVIMTLIALTLLLNLILFNSQFVLNSFIIMLNIYLKTMVVLAFVICWSVYIRPVISLLFGLSFYFYGHGINSIEFLIKKTKDENLIAIHSFLERISPQFFRFNWKNFYFLKEGPSGETILIMVGYFSLWILLLTVLAIRGFNRKDIT